MPRFDWAAIRIGVVAGALVILPATIISSVLLDDSSASEWVVVFTFVTLLGFSVSGFAAGSRVTDTPMIHGAVAGFAAWAIVQALGLIRRLASGDDVTWTALPVAALFATTFAVTGAVLADWNRRRKLREEGN